MARKAGISRSRMATAKRMRPYGLNEIATSSPTSAAEGIAATGTAKSILVAKWLDICLDLTSS